MRLTDKDGNEYEFTATPDLEGALYGTLKAATNLPWIEWHATKDSECPVPEGTKGNVRLLNEREFIVDDDLNEYDWRPRGGVTIVAYQVTYMPRPEIGRKVMITHENGNKIGPLEVNKHGIKPWTWAGYEEFTTNGTWRSWKYVTEKRLMTRDEALEFIIDNPTMLVRRDDKGLWGLPGGFVFGNGMEGYEYTLRDDRTEPRRFEEDV